MSNMLDDRAMDAAGEIAVHPERKALAGLYNMLSILVFAVGLLVLMCAPAVIWWAYHVAVR